MATAIGQPIGWTYHPSIHLSLPPETYDVGITSADLRVDVDDSLGCIILWVMPLDGGDAMQVLLSPRPPPSTLILRVVAQLTKLEQEDET